MENLELFSEKVSALTSLTFKALMKIDQKSNDQPNAFLYTLAFKTNNGLNTANSLIADILRKPHFCDSLFLILRTLLSDSITYFYLMTVSQNDNEDNSILAENIKKLEADHLRFSYNNLEIYRLLYNDTDKDIGQRKSALRNEFPDYFNPDGGIKKFKNLTVTGMVKEIAKSNYEPAIYGTVRAFGLYDTFSKLEHLGMLTTQLVTRQFDENNHKQILGEIYQAVHVISYMLHSILITFITTNEIEQFTKLKEEVLSIKIYD